jgi:hypothetical protein
MFSAAVRVGSRLNAWKTNPSRSRRRRVRPRSSSALTSVPPTTSRPLLTVSSPARQCSRVDLPEPDGPMTAVSWPAAKPTDTWSRAVTVVAPRP